MMRRMDRRGARGPVFAASCAAIGILNVAGPASAAAKLPEIRTSAENRVPVCVTPDRLMSFLKSRNGSLDARYKDIAKAYKTYGEAWRVRWDYAFFQMAVETNFLSYRQPNGRMGDVDPSQNNFAGIGTTGGGVPGDSFPDVKTGVHAQIQHLVVYSGERLAAPIAERTKLKQDDILLVSLALERPVRWSDLARRWAVDKNYHKSIEWVAGAYRSKYCRGGDDKAEAPASDRPDPLAAEAPASRPGQVALADAVAEARPEAATKPARSDRAHPAVRTVWRRGEPSSDEPAPPAMVIGAPSATALQDAAVKSDPVAAPAEPDQEEITPSTEGAAAEGAAIAGSRPATAQEATEASSPSQAMAPPAGLGANSLACSVGQASYGGTRTVLLRSPEGESTRYVALTVHAGFERSMTASYIKARAPGSKAIGEFDSPAAALEKARALCPGP